MTTPLPNVGDRYRAMSTEQPRVLVIIANAHGGGHWRAGMHWPTAWTEFVVADHRDVSAEPRRLDPQGAQALLDDKRMTVERMGASQ